MPAKPIVITDDSVVNDHGFRVMTDGGDLTMYMRNPIMLYDHTRRQDDDKDVILPIGTMKELHRQGNQIIATPDFDMDDDFAAQIASKYEKGIFNMASIGFEAVEWSEDPALMLPGQMYPTVTKWILKEVSIVDYGANPNCCKVMHAGKTLKLSGNTPTEEVSNFFNSNKPNLSMKKVIAALNGSKLVTLSDASNEELVAEAVITLSSRLSDKDQKIAQLDQTIVTLRSEIETAKTAGLKDKATTLVEAALSGNKIVAEQKEKFVKLASASEDGYSAVKDMLDSLKPYKPVMEVLSGAAPAVAGAVAYTSLKDEFEKRAADGSLETLRASNLDHFKQVYKAGTKKEFKD